MPLQTINTFCSEADVTRLLSVAGATAQLDDDGDGTVDATEDLAMNDALVQGSMDIQLYLFDKYDPVNLANSNQVNRWATDLSAYYLCSRRGNPVPESIQERFDRATERLERINAGSLRGLPDVPMRASQAPGFSNQRAVVWYQFRVLRTVKSTSQPQTTTQRQNVDYQDRWTVDYP